MSLILAVAVVIALMVLVVGTLALGRLPARQYDFFSGCGNVEAKDAFDVVVVVVVKELLG
jgi:hypothetical protein